MRRIAIVAAGALASLAQLAGAQAAEDWEPGLAEDGLQLIEGNSGRVINIRFGYPRSSVAAAMKGEGRPVTGVNAACPGGAVSFARYPDGLTVRFRNDKFVGWTATAPAKGDALTDMAGIGPGSTLAQYHKVYTGQVAKTAAGYMIGSTQFDGAAPSSKIVKTWSGVTCDR